MKHLLYTMLTFAGAAATLFTACDNSDEVGASLDQSDVSIVIDSVYELKARSVPNNRLLSRTTTQLLGSIEAKGYGALTSDVVTQFMPAAEIDTDGVTVDDIDSLKIVFSIPNGGYIGDSIAPMGLQIYRLTRQLPKQIYSNFDPTGYYDPEQPIAQKVYASNAMGYSDSIQNLSYRGVTVKLPVELGRELFTLYKDNPAVFSTPTAFTEYFPGLYIKTTYGQGCIIRVSNTLLQMYYHKQTTDDNGKPVQKNLVGYYFGVTPEIVTNNILSFDMADDLNTLAATQPVISAPTGVDVELVYPLPEMISRYKDNKGTLSVINDLQLRIKALPVANDYGIAPPPALLLTLSRDRDKFFANNSLTDGSTSWVADYDSSTGTYTFTGMRQYLVDALANENLTAEDYTFTLTPVYINSVIETDRYGQQYSTISSIVPYINTPAITLIDIKNSKIILTYSNQSIKF